METKGVKRMGRPPTGRQRTFSVTIPDKLREVIEEDAKKRERSIAGQIRHILLTHYKVEA